MSSKLNGIDSSTAAIGAGRAVQPVPDATARSQGAPGASGASVDVHITDTATQLATLEKTVRDMPAIDDARVNEIKSALESGHYTVSPERVADGLLRSEQALAPLGDL